MSSSDMQNEMKAENSLNSFPHSLDRGNHSIAKDSAEFCVLPSERTLVSFHRRGNVNGPTSPNAEHANICLFQWIWLNATFTVFEVASFHEISTCVPDQTCSKSSLNYSAKCVRYLHFRLDGEVSRSKVDGGRLKSQMLREVSALDFFIYRCWN